MASHLLDTARTIVRTYAERCAGLLDRASGGRIRPDHVTIVGALAHIPIALLIASGEFAWLAALLLAVFGLFDTLDGSLARLQKTSSNGGMLLDASVDRMKEALVYVGIAYLFAAQGNELLVAIAVVACGASLTVSYVKAKGEAAVASASKAIDHAKLNRMFSDGVLTFEVRMALLVLGLLLSALDIAVIVIALGASFTALQRLVRIRKALTD